MANLVRWEPFGETVSLRDAMDRLFEQSFLRPFNGGSDFFRSMAVDMHETDDEIVVKAAVPGLKPEDVKVTLSGDVLTIAGEHKTESDKKETTYHLRERQYGTFSRSITLPAPVAGDKVNAEFENGVVTLTLPKAEEARPRTIKIKAKK